MFSLLSSQSGSAGGSYELYQLSDTGSDTGSRLGGSSDGEDVELNAEELDRGFGVLGSFSDDGNWDGKKECWLAGDAKADT
jgi:hypothetical protein